MFCRQCGEGLNDGARFCPACGYDNRTVKNVDLPSKDMSLVGYSAKINDPAFTKFMKNSNQYIAIFSGVIALIAVVGFTISGEMGWDNLKNPQAMYIGLTIGGMFALIGIFSILGRVRSKTWDGSVVDKRKKRQTDRRRTDDGGYLYDDYMEYRVEIRRDNGKKYYITARNDDTLYNYYKIGDRIRHHGGLLSYEKYDKTGDAFIPCNACATLCDIHDDTCYRCKCPLLK